jgi:hypothetical protein
MMQRVLHRTQRGRRSSMPPTSKVEADDDARASLRFHRAKKVRVAGSQHERQRERFQVVDFFTLRHRPQTVEA